MKDIEKGNKRYALFQQYHEQKFGSRFSGRLLDFGCGAGAFLISALNDKIDVHGIEVEAARQTQFMRTAEKYGPDAKDRFTLYDGRLMPYPSNHFDGCHSWFVFEHVTDPQTSLREIVRTLKPGGTLSIWADDVRNAWDGHAAAPWPPYLPREFAPAYLEGLGMAQRAEFISSYVVYVSAPQICDILTTLGMKIVYANASPKRDTLPDGIYIASEQDAVDFGKRVKQLMESGAFSSPSENLCVFATKPTD